MKSFKNFNEGAASMMSGSDTARQKKIDKQGSTPTRAKKAIQRVWNYLAPPPSRSNEPTVRSGERRKDTGGWRQPSIPSRGPDGYRKDGSDSTPAPAKLDAGTRGETMPSNPQFRGVGARPKTKTKTDKQPPGDDKQPPGGDKQPPQERVRPQKPSAKNNPDNAAYIKKRDAAKAATGDAKKKATAAAEKEGMAAWRKANKGLADAKDKRDATRGTSKSTNPLMKKYIKDRESRRERVSAISKQAKADTIANSPNADSINKKQTERQASVDKAIKSVNTPKTPEASAKTPTKALANTGSGRTGGFGTGTFGRGMPSNPPIRAKAPAAAPAATPAAVKPTPIKVEPYQGKSKGGEVKKKTKKESFLGFGEYLAEKKTKIKLNPKKEDMLEKTMKPEKGEDCHCDHTKNEKKKRKEDTDHTEGTPEVSNESINQEVLAYVSQEEVSEEGYQEGNQTETDLTEASFEIGPGHRGAMRGKKIYDKGKGTTNPHEKDAFLKRTGPQLPLAKGKKSLETAGYEPETEGEQLDEISGEMLKGIYPKGMSKGLKQTIKPGGSNALGVKSDATSAGGGKFYTNNARLLARAPAQYIRGKVPEPSLSANTPTPKPAAAAKPAAPKPNPIQANRPGFDSKGVSTKPKPNVSAAPSTANKPGSANSPSKPAKKVSTGKKPGQIDWDKFNESRLLRSFASMCEDRAEDAKKSLDKVKKRQGVLDDYEKKTGTKLDINKSVEAREHKKNFPGAKRTGKKKRGEKESELETQNRRVNKYNERLRKHGKTKKQKEYDDAMSKHSSRFD